MSKTLWRDLLYQKLAKHPLSGRVLDVGGDRSSGYHDLILSKESSCVIANLETIEAGDIACNLEQGIPAPDASFDNVLCINVLEHIFNYEQLLREMHRVMRPGGALILAVPFLIAYHPSPRDHWRFTKETLERIVNDAGFHDVKIEAIGTGVFGALYQLSHGFLHFNILRFLALHLARGLDRLVSVFKKDSFYSATYYPLGYVVRAEK